MDKKKAKFRVRVSELNLGFKHNIIILDHTCLFIYMDTEYPDSYHYVNTL